MSAWIRHLSTSLLCAFIALGHIPAWYHAATCDHSNCCDNDSRCGWPGQASPGENSAHETVRGEIANGEIASEHAGCAQCGCASHAPAVKSVHTGHVTRQHSDGSDVLGGVEKPGHSHDPDTCSICHTLAVPSGFNDPIVLATCDQTPCEPTRVFQVRVDVASHFSLPPLRGPPTFTV